MHALDLDQRSLLGIHRAVAEAAAGGQFLLLQDVIADNAAAFDGASLLRFAAIRKRLHRRPARLFFQAAQVDRRHGGNHLPGRGIGDGRRLFRRLQILLQAGEHDKEMMRGAQVHVALFRGDRDHGFRGHVAVAHEADLALRPLVLRCRFQAFEGRAKGIQLDAQFLPFEQDAVLGDVALMPPDLLAVRVEEDLRRDQLDLEFLRQRQILLVAQADKLDPQFSRLLGLQLLQRRRH